MMHKTNDVLHSIISNIQENILIKLFGSEHVNIKTLLLMSSQIVEHANEYEFEMRYVDGGGSVSRDTWLKFNNLFNDDISLVSYDDDIIFTHHTNVPLRDIHFRSFKNSNKYERKMVISRIRSRPESKKVLPLSVRLSRETPMSPANELQSYDNIQRRQRYTYQFKDPSLSDWRIDKTIRFFTESVDDKKLHFKPGIDNIDTLKYYDSLDIEFEYIGEFSMICTEFFRLIEKIYTPFEDFDMKYNFVKHAFNKCGVSFESLFSLIPLPAIMTNGILQHLNVNDFSFSYRINGEHSIFIVIINGNRKENLSKSDILMLSIADGSMRHVYGSLDLLTQTVNQHPANEDEIIPRRLVSFMMHEDKTIAPLVYVFEAECITDKNEFILIDTMLYKSKNMLNNILPDRIACIDKFMKLKNNFIRTHISKNKLINMRGKSIDSLLLTLHTRESGDVYDSTCLVCKQIDAPLPESLVYKVKSNSTSLSIDFKICYVPRKKAFYLYVTGMLRNVIKNKTVMNEMSLEHFGYSLINAQSNREVYLLFVSPYMKNSHVFKPRLEWDSSTVDATTRNKIDILMRDIVENPLRYNHMIVKMIKVSDGWVPLSACGYTNDYLEYINRNSSITALTKSFLSCPSFTGNIDIEAENGKRMKDISRSSSYLKMMNHLAVPHAYREALNISSLIYDNINSRNFQLNERGKRLKTYSNHMQMRSFLTSNQTMLMKSLYALIDQYLIEKFMNAYDNENILDIFSVSGKAETFVHHGFLVDGTRDKNVYQTCLEFGDGSVQRCYCALCGFGSRLSGLGETVVRQAVDDVYALGLGLGGGVDGVGVHLLDLGDGLSIEAEQFGRAVDHRSELVEYPGVGKRLYYDFVADSVGIALRDAYYDLVVLHIDGWLFVLVEKAFGKVSPVFRQVRRGICLYRESVAALVLRMSGVPLYPVETQLEVRAQLVESRPKVIVLLALPVFGDRVHDVGGVAEHPDFGAFPAYRLQPLDDRQKLHAVVGRKGETPGKLLPETAADEHDAVPSRARVTA